MSYPEIERPISDVLFDVNGTLLDMSVLGEQNKHLAREVFGREITDEEIRACWGQPAQTFYPMLFGDSIPWQELRLRHQSYDYLFPRRLLAGVQGAIQSLQQANVRTSIVTSGKQDRVHAYLQQAGLDLAHFALIYTEPHLREAQSRDLPIIAKAIKHLGSSTSRTLIVGDEVNNMLDARAAGAQYILIARGTRTEGELRSAGVPVERILPDISHLPAFLGIER